MTRKSRKILKNLSQQEVVTYLTPYISITGHSANHFVAAITGEGNAGKTTLAHTIRKTFGENTCSIIEIDNFVIPRSRRIILGYSGYNPKAFDVKSYAEAIRELSRGSTVWTPFYDHFTGNTCMRTACKAHNHITEAKPILLCVGVFMWDKENFKSFDLSIYCHSKHLAKKDRIERDIRERGYSRDYAEQHYEILQKDKLKYIIPSINHCELLVNRHEDRYDLFRIE
jgi:uridine kinase